VTTLLAESRPQRGADIVWRRADAGVVVLKPSDGQYFSLDDVGGRIWELCEGTQSVAEIAETLAQEYDAPAAVIERDALELLEDLEGEGLVRAV
jgi:coenzyme PQQ biosynthesis protein PqqD